MSRPVQVVLSRFMAHGQRFVVVGRYASLWVTVP